MKAPAALLLLRVSRISALTRRLLLDLPAAAMARTRTVLEAILPAEVSRALGANCFTPAGLLVPLKPLVPAGALARSESSVVLTLVLVRAASAAAVATPAAVAVTPTTAVTDNDVVTVPIATPEKLVEDRDATADDHSGDADLHCRLEDSLPGVGVEQTASNAPVRTHHGREENNSHNCENQKGLHGLFLLSAIGGKRTVVSRATHLRRNSPKINFTKNI
ncbi:MAG: hypothetical protein UY60_C0001G0003 [Parcubacteria group bacterium GW2011_GWB1_50_9]|nr:MAG: hypothetical protein UY60_C0001G0003 [Parcubacteria group bacterium GW2011_GWB1_50_9]